MHLAYDGLGRRRLERRRLTSTTQEAVVLEYAGGNVIEEALATTTGAGGIVLSVTHGPGLDVPLLVAKSSSSATLANSFFFGSNARGDVVSALRADTGDVVEEQVLDPWGERTLLRAGAAPCIEGGEGGSGSAKFSKPLGPCGPATTTAILGRFGIGGAREDRRTKLVDLRNRVYATHLRSFLSKDPLGDVDSKGLFNYVAADPINLRDPWGLTAGKSAGADAGGLRPGERKCKRTDNGGETCWTRDANGQSFDDDGCATDSGGDSCRRAAEVERRRAVDRAEDAEREASKQVARDIRSGVDRDQGTSTPHAGSPSAPTPPSLPARVGQWVSDVAEGLLHRINSAGAPGGPGLDYSGAPKLGSAAETATEVGAVVGAMALPALLLDSAGAVVGYELIEGGSAITAELGADGFLETAVTARTGGVPGHKLFADALRVFGDRVKGIRGNWGGGGGMSTNFMKHRAAVEEGASDVEAAFTTNTGRWAQDAGFTSARVVEDSPGNVIVEFFR